MMTAIPSFDSLQQIDLYMPRRRPKSKQKTTDTITTTTQTPPCSTPTEDKISTKSMTNSFAKRARQIWQNIWQRKKLISIAGRLPRPFVGLGKHRLAPKVKELHAVSSKFNADRSQSQEAFDGFCTPIAHEPSFYNLKEALAAEKSSPLHVHWSPKTSKSLPAPVYGRRPRYLVSKCATPMKKHVLSRAEPSTKIQRLRYLEDSKSVGSLSSSSSSGDELQGPNGCKLHKFMVFEEAKKVGNDHRTVCFR